jgi:transposase
MPLTWGFGDNLLVAKGYRRVDREQVFLLPPDMREWLPVEHRVWFVLDVVRALDTSAFHVRSRRGSVGRQGYDPDMLLAVLIYAYLVGVLSSRAMERACHTDVAFRVLCAQDVPDHSTLARFRQDHQDALAGLFEQVLLLCARAGMGSFGTVAIDGTKIQANASLGANRTKAWLQEQVRQLLDQADRVDAAEQEAVGAEAVGDELDPGWRDPHGRQDRLRQALAEATAEDERQDAKARAPQVDKAQRRIDRAEQRLKRVRDTLTARAESERKRIAAGGQRYRAVPVEQHCQLRQAEQKLLAARANLTRAEGVGRPGSSERVANLTDPQSRKMRSPHGFVQGYNAQLAVSGDGVILAATLTQSSPDTEQFLPMMQATEQAVARIRSATGRADATIGTIVADAGYASAANITAAGPDRLIATGSVRHLVKDAEKAGSITQWGSPAIAAMAIKVAEQAHVYHRRGATVEPVHAHVKDRRRLRRFSRRGLAAAGSELIMAAWVTNLAKLFTQLAAQPA